MKNFRIIIGIMMFVPAVSLCIGFTAYAQGQGQGQEQGQGQNSLPTLQAELDQEKIDRADGDAALQEQITAIVSDPGLGDVRYTIGDTGPAGGIVFYVIDGGLHGLEAAPADQGLAAWGCYLTSITGADGTAVGTGAQNTYDILGDCSETGTAAEIANAYTYGGYGDWFLPSKGELNLLYQQKNVVGGFASGIYWSSSEYNSYDAWQQHFTNGGQLFNFKNDDARRVRAVRAF
jgi:hypothetical protein